MNTRTESTTPRRQFIGDWPDYFGYGTAPCGRNDGVGPTYSDIICEACGALVLASGECRCS